MGRIIDIILGETKREPKKQPGKKVYRNIRQVIIVYTREGKTQVLLRDTDDNDIDLGHVEIWEIEDKTKVKRAYGGDDFEFNDPGVTLIEAHDDTPFTVEYESEGVVEVPQQPYFITASKITIK